MWILFGIGFFSIHSHQIMIKNGSNKNNDTWVKGHSSRCTFDYLCIARALMTERSKF